MTEHLDTTADPATTGHSTLHSTGRGADTPQDLVARYVASVNNLDEDLAREVWSQRHEVTFIHPRGHEVGIEAVWQSFYRETMGRFARRTLEVVSQDFRPIDETSAWIEFTWKFQAFFAEDDSELNTAGRETQIIVLEDGLWRLVHVHYSSMPTTGDREGF